MLEFRLTVATLVLVSCTGVAQESPPPRSTPEIDVTPDAQGSISQSKIEQLFRVVGQKDMENDKRRRDYTYLERQVENRLDAKGKIKSTEVKTYEVLKFMASRSSD